MSLAWIASYPKSGNTWVRIMILSYLEDRPVEMGRNNEPVLPAASVVQDVKSLVEAGTSWSARWPDRVTAKTHFLPGVDVHRPYRDVTSKVLYLVRNPRDVIRSAERHLNVVPEHRAAYARHFITHHGFDGWRRTGWGTWAESVAEWAAPERYFPKADAWVLRYEDIKTDPAGSLSRILTFLELVDQVDDARVERAVQNSRLETMRAQEQQINGPESNRNPFFGAGLSGQSLQDYGEDVEESYLRLLDGDSEFAELAKHWGYTA